MAHNRNYKPEDIAFPNQVITESPLVKEMESSDSSSRAESCRNSRTFSTPSTVTMPVRKITNISSTARSPVRFFGGSVRPVPYSQLSWGE